MGNTVRGIVSAYVDGEKLWEATNTITNSGKNWLAARLHDPNRDISFDSQGRGMALVQRAHEDFAYPGQLGHFTTYNSLYPDGDPVVPSAQGASALQRSYVAWATNPEESSTGETLVQTNNLGQQQKRSRAELRLGRSNQATSVDDTKVIDHISGSYWPGTLHHNQSSYFTSGRFQSTTANTDNATNADMEFNFQPNRENHDTLGYAIGTTVDAAGNSIGSGGAGSKTITANATSITVATPHLFPVAVQNDSSTHYFIEITDTSGGANDGDKEIVKVTDTGTHAVSSRKPAIALTGHGLTAPKPYVRPYFTRTSEFTIVRAQKNTSAMAFPTQFDTDSSTNRGHTFKTLMHRNVHYYATTGANNVLKFPIPLEGSAPNGETEVYVAEAALMVEANAVQPSWAQAGYPSSTSLETWGYGRNVCFSRVVFPSPIKFTKDSFLFELVWDIQFP